MTDREKLVELLSQRCDLRKMCVGCKDRLALAEECKEKRFGKVADFLLANGVTLQTSKTDLTGKCGSCAYARPTTAFGGSKCYVACKNPEKRFKGAVAHLRHRTCKACKMYKPLPEALKEE